MAIDTPARIAVLGAGPIGLEAALYARFLGYEVSVYERGRVAEHVLQCGHVRLFAPWKLLVSPLGLAALQAQDPGWRPPADDTLVSGRQWAETYLAPLAASDLLADSIQTQTQVVAIARRGLLKSDDIDRDDRGECELLVQIRDAQGGERIDKVDAVVDATGTFAQPNHFGPGGLTAIGISQVAADIEFGLPDIAESANRYAGKRVLLIGAGHAAATNLLALSALEPKPQVTWVTRRGPDEAPHGPIRHVPDDPLAARDRLARSANALAQEPPPWLRHLPGTWVKQLEPAAGGIGVRLIGEHKQELEIDRLIASVGHRPDHALAAELQVGWRPATGAPLPLSPDTAGGAQRLVLPEPDYYVIGARSFGRRSGFQFVDGLRQIRDLFTIIGDRAELDLYRTIGSRSE